MCGIAGQIGVSPDEIENLVSHMLRSIAHRGPDDEGLWHEGDVCFGQRRLSIIDLSPAGHQPMVSQSGRWVMTMNGEIYNFPELRRRLEGDGPVTWKGHSDSEVLLAMVERHGLNVALEQAKGMFALALWDRQTRTAYLARDRMGEKPLYYTCDERRLAFASELTALEVAVDVSSSLSRDALAAYFRFGYIPAPFSILRDVRKLEPGSLLTWRGGRRPSVTPYWSLSEVIDAGRHHRIVDPKEAADGLETLLRKVVSRQMVSDVPIGMFLSGGLDSALITAVMQAEAQSPVQTFTLGFESREFNEAEQAKALAGHLGTNHTEHYVTVADAQAIVPRLGYLYDEPFADSSQIPTFLVSEMARRNVKVCLTGDGGDEMFGGYVRYPGVRRLWRTMRRMPARKLIAGSLERLPLPVLAMGLWWLRPFARRYASRGQLGPNLRRAGRWLRSNSMADLFEETMSFWPREGPLRPPVGSPTIGWRPPSPVFDNELEPMLWRDTVDYLPGDLLCKVDRAAMAVGLETRAPFLDPDMVEFAWRIPPTMKVRGRVTKWLPRQVLARFAPRSLTERPKLGFSVPLHEWLRGGLNEWASDLTAPARLRRQGLIDPQPVEEAWRRLRGGDSGQAQPIWAVVMLQAWLAARGG
ncbi:MAG TPA: asparagine synthase (glutamine-hydrolyzing) [Caulobacteraceae bacterium]